MKSVREIYERREISFEPLLSMMEFSSNFHFYYSPTIIMPDNAVFAVSLVGDFLLFRNPRWA